MKLGIDQSKAKVGRGWTCGNHTKAVRDRIQTQLEKEYTEALLNGLIGVCVSGEFDENYEIVLSELVKKVPPIFVNGILQKYYR